MQRYLLKWMHGTFAHDTVIEAPDFDHAYQQANVKLGIPRSEFIKIVSIELI